MHITLNIQADSPEELRSAVNGLSATYGLNSINSAPAIITETLPPSQPAAPQQEQYQPTHLTPQQHQAYQQFPAAPHQSAPAAPPLSAPPQQDWLSYGAPGQQTPPPQYPPQQTVPTSTTSYTIDQLSVAATQLVDAGRRADLVGLLSSFGVASLTELPKEHYGNFATQLRAMGAKI